MKFMHTECGGEIINRTCQRCKKHWNPISYMFTPTGIRAVPGTPRAPSKVVLPSTPQQVASLLPKWPRWARVLSVVAVLGLIALVIILIRR